MPVFAHQIEQGQAHPAPCRCDAYPFPHRAAGYCEQRRDAGEAAEATAEARYQQAMWDLDRARAVR